MENISEGCIDPTQVWLRRETQDHVVPEESRPIASVTAISFHDIDNRFRTVSLDDIRKIFSGPACCPPDQQATLIPDPWKHRSIGMKCRTCMFFVQKVTSTLPDEHNCSTATPSKVGRCRRHAPTMNGYPVVYLDDWCGDHKVDENKV